MRRVFAVVLAMLLVFGLAACGEDQPTNAPTQPQVTQPQATQPQATEPAPTEPAPTEPAPTEPAPTEPAPTEPAPTEPAPTEPAPTEPAPTEPAPTEPAPTEPAPTEPAPTEPPHTHAYTEKTVAPTCTEAGYTVHTCACGDTYQDAVVEAKGHSYSEATCTAPKTCANCGAEDGKPAGHSFNAASCTEGQTCSVCGAAGQAAVGHKYQNGACSVCGEADPTAHGLTGGEWYWFGEMDEEGTLFVMRFNDDGTGGIYIYYGGVSICENPENFEEGGMQSLVELNGIYFVVFWPLCGGDSFAYQVIDGNIHLIPESYDDTSSLVILEKVDNDHYQITQGAEGINWAVVGDVFTWAHDHVCNEGSCTEKKVCSVCGWDFGLQHQFENKACGNPGVCSLCGAEGPVVDHYFWGGFCQYCGAPDEEFGG